jgi:hypothetical protein
MVEYGGGIGNGPAGQVGGGAGAGSGGGGHAVAQTPDIFASVTHTLGDVVNQVLALPTEVLAVGIVAFFLGLIVLKRAF